MAGTLTARDFWDLVQHILPFYIILLISYGMSKKNILAPIHSPGLNRWTSLVGIPLYVGNMLAFNDPYAINLRLVGADALQKAIALLVAGLWWRFSQYGSIDGAITFFMLATLSNMVLVGPALFEPLHRGSSKVSIATIIILQCALWYNICIALFETRVVLKEMNATANPAEAVLITEDEVAHTERLPFENVLEVLPSSLDEDLKEEMGKKARLQRTTSAPAHISISTVSVMPIDLYRPNKMYEEEDYKTPQMSPDEEKRMINNVHAVNNVEMAAKLARSDSTTDVNKEGQSVSVDITDAILAVNQGRQYAEMNKFQYAKVLAIKVLNRMKYAPLTYTSIIGFVYSLFAFKYDWKMPYPIKTSIQLVANGAIAISVVTMAITWKDSGRLISCGVRKMVYGFIIRFLVGPIVMVVCALACGLTGIAFEFAVLQAALPVGLVSFVLAKEYGLDIEVFATAVTTQLVIFLPLVTLYYFILQPIGV